MIIGFCFVLFSCGDKKEDFTKALPTEEVEISGSAFDSLIGKDFLVDDLHSYIGFKIKYFGYSPVRGRFDEFDGTVFFDPEKPGAFSVSTIIDMQSINTGNERRDNDLIKEGGWFDVTNFPLAKFTSTGVTLHENGFYLNGNLTIKGISKAVTIDFEKPLDVSRDSFMNYQFSLYGTLSIHRKDFDVVGGDFWTTTMENGLMQLSNEVEIEIELHCRRNDYNERYKELDSLNVRVVVLDRIKNNGIETGLTLIDSLYRNEQINSGALSTVGYILIEWDMKEEALAVFNRKKTLFGDNAILQNQLGVTHLSRNNKDKAMEAFNAARELDSTNSRSTEYLKLLGNLKDE